MFQQLEPRLQLAVTPQLIDLKTGIGSSMVTDTPEFVAAGGQVIFNARVGSGDTLFSSDGTVGGTNVIKNRDMDLSGARFFLPFGERQLFTGNDTNTSVSPRFGPELWVTNGTTAGTVPVADIRIGPAGSQAIPLGVVGNVALLTADDGASGTELWKSDGTSQGTTFVKDINPGANSSLTNFLKSKQAVVGTTLFFSADDGEHGVELWKSDGTAEGTVLVKDIFPGTQGSFPSDLIVVGETVFFVAEDPVVGKELWKSDGTTAGTVVVRDILPGAESSRVTQPVVFGGAVFFAASDGVGGRELWKSDGTDAGTVPVLDVNPGSASSFPQNFLAVGKTLYFQAEDQVRGAELWKSDGTAEGTVPVADICPGQEGSFPEELAAIGKTVFFSADDGVHGVELWKSDGTAAGTVLVQDLRTGPEGSFVHGITGLGNSLFFVADDGIHGREPWTMVFPNEAPTNIGLSASATPENNAVGAVIGGLTTSDPNESDIHSYQLVNGPGAADNAAFTIDGDVLKAARRFNFELQDRFSIRIRSTDQGGLSTEKAVEITVNDVVDEPLVVESVAAPAPASFRPGQVLPFTVILSRSVEVRGRPQLQLQAGSVARRAVFAAAATRPVLTFNYRVRGLDNAETVAVGSRLFFPVGSGIKSGLLSLATPLPQAGQVLGGIRLDSRPPRIVGKATAPAAGTFGIGQPLDFRVRFSEPVFVSGTPRINLGGLATPRQATIFAGSGTQELTFRYVVQAGDRLVRPGSLTLGRRIGLGAPVLGAIVDAAGNRALLAGVTTVSLAGIALATP